MSWIITYKNAQGQIRTQRVVADTEAWAVYLFHRMWYGVEILKVRSM